MGAMGAPPDTATSDSTRRVERRSPTSPTRHFWRDLKERAGPEVSAPVAVSGCTLNGSGGNPTAIVSSTAARRHLSSPSPRSPREARTGRGLGRGVSELGQQSSSPRPSPPLVGGEGDLGSSRRRLNSMAGDGDSLLGETIPLPDATRRLSELSCRPRRALGVTLP